MILLSVPVLMTLLGIGAVASITTLFAYTIGNSGWFHSAFGRAMVAFSASFSLFLSYGFLRLLFDWPINRQWQVIEFGIIVVLLIHNAVAALAERRKWKK